jgi:DNA-binding NtrC family response regulator
LVVDDEAATRQGLSELLNGAGYACRAAESFQEANEIVKGDPPDLLITDIRLNGYNGLQLVLLFPDLPAIVMTGYADKVLEEEATRAGATYIRKPLRVDELLQLVRHKIGPPDHFASSS